MYDLAQFSMKDMSQCSSWLRRAGEQAHSMEEASTNIVRYLYDQLVDTQTGDKACVLARFFVTQSYKHLDSQLRTFADGLMGELSPSADMKCLTLLATVGSRPEWNARAKSEGHQTIPLSSPEAVARIPMVAQLIKQFELDITTVLRPAPELLLALGQQTFNVFHVPEALGSPHIPAQEEFVKPYAVRSVLGFGGVLPSGSLYALILFARVQIPRMTADLFKPLALSVKIALLPFDDAGTVFAR